MASRVGSWVNDWDQAMTRQWQCCVCDTTTDRHEDYDYCEYCYERMV